MTGQSETGAAARFDGWSLVIAIIAMGSILNALWMLVAPAQWYAHLPAGVPDTGPLNIHFVRDIGCAFLTAGLALAWSLWRPELRFPLVTTAAFFYVAHAVLHVHDTGRGIVDAHHWLLDLPGVYLPAALLVAASLRFARAAGGAR